MVKLSLGTTTFLAVCSETGLLFFSLHAIATSNELELAPLAGKKRMNHDNDEDNARYTVEADVEEAFSQRILATMLDSRSNDATTNTSVPSSLSFPLPHSFASSL